MPKCHELTTHGGLDDPAVLGEGGLHLALRVKLAS
jgi:hypothetical protein